jgi:hypothetical protein
MLQRPEIRRRLCTWIVLGAAMGMPACGDHGRGAEGILSARQALTQPSTPVPNPDPLPGDAFGIRIRQVPLSNGGLALAVGTDDSEKVCLIGWPGGAPLRSSPLTNPRGGQTGFGRSLAAFRASPSGPSYVVVGASLEGTVSVFNAETGAPFRTFYSPRPRKHEGFGRAVAGHGNRVLISAWLDSRGKDTGGAYLFDVNSGALLATFSSPPIPKGTNAWFGYTVAFAGVDLLVGDPAQEKVYRYSGNGAPRHTLAGPADSWFGGALDGAEDGSALVGAPALNVYTREGAAYLYNAAGGLEKTLSNPQSNPDWPPYFGGSVSFVNGTETYLLVGAPMQYSDAGAAYLFDTTSNTQPLATFARPTQEPWGFGGSVAGMGSGGVAISAPGVSIALDGGVIESAGEVYFFFPGL